MTDHVPQRQPASDDEIATRIGKKFDVMLLRERDELRTELARLRAEVERLRVALGEYADESNWDCHTRSAGLSSDAVWIGPNADPWQLAADALRGEGGEDG